MPLSFCHLVELTVFLWFSWFICCTRINLFTMPRKCVAQYCENNAGPQICLHKFPTEPKLWNKWRKFVELKRCEWKPSPFSYVCSDHFTRDSYENFAQFTCGHASRLILRKDAIPTIQAKPPPQEGKQTPPEPSRPDTAMRKRSFHQVRF